MANTQLQTRKTTISPEQERLIVSLPVWDPSVWKPLQKKDFKTAMDSFYSLLSYYSRKTVLDILWKNILEGSPEVRGTVSMNEWRMEVIPYLAFIVLDIADETLIEKIYSSLDPETLFYFHAAVVFQIPGNTYEEKYASLTKEKLWLYEYFLGSPLNVFQGGLFMPVSENIAIERPEKVESRLKELPLNLRIAIYSIENARLMVEKCRTYSLEDSKIADCSYIVGCVLLGLRERAAFASIFDSEIDEEWKNFVQEIEDFFITPFESDIVDFKRSTESVIQEKEVSVPVAVVEEKAEKPVKINKVEFPKAAENQAVDPSAPFMLRTEEDSSLKKPAVGNTSKGFSFPFGFFKRNAIPQQNPQISVKIESAAEPSGPTGTPKIQKPASSVFESLKKDIAPAAEEKSVFGSVSQEMKETDAKKTVHYSQFHTKLPDPNPHVEGNTVSFK